MTFAGTRVDEFTKIILSTFDFEHGRYDDACRQLEAAIREPPLRDHQESPKMAVALRSLGRLLNAAGNHTEALSK